MHVTCDRRRPPHYGCSSCMFISDFDTTSDVGIYVKSTYAAAQQWRRSAGSQERARSPRWVPEPSWIEASHVICESESPTFSTPNRRELLVGAAALSATAMLPPAALAQQFPTAKVNTTGLAVTDTEVTVGILHSVTGTMAISETGSVQAEKLAIEQINAQGGVLGRKIKFIQEDGGSDWPTFAEKAKKLLVNDKVASVMGCWTSASRKAVLPVFEQYNGMLYYPTFYEGPRALEERHLHRPGGDAADHRRPRLGAEGEGRQDLLPARLRLHLAAHLEQDRAQAHRELPQAEGRRRGIFPARPHAVQLRHQQDEADQAGRDLRDHRRRLQRRLLQAAQGGRLRSHQADADDDLGHRGRNRRHRRRKHRRRLCLHEILPVARQSQQQGVRVEPSRRCGATRPSSAT